MPVDSQHDRYAAMASKWERARAANDGEDTVKEGGQKYLKKLPGMEAGTDDYNIFLDGAVWFPASGRTTDGLVGAAMRKDPSFDLGPLPESFEDDADLAYTPLVQMARDVLEEMVVVGFVGLLSEWSEEENRAFLVRYKAEDIVNWMISRIGGRMVTAMVVLREVTRQMDADGFRVVRKEQYRVLRLVDSELDEDVYGVPEGDPIVRVDVYQREEDEKGKQTSDWAVVETHFPKTRTGNYTAIPFVAATPNGLGFDLINPPIYNVVGLNFHHYTQYADYKNALKFCGFPIGYGAGVPPKQAQIDMNGNPAEDKDMDIVLGSPRFYLFENADAKLAFAQVSDSGFKPMRDELEDLRTQMAVAGARLLEEQKRAAETEGAVRLRQSGDSSVLKDLVMVTSRAIEMSLRFCGMYTTEDVSNIAFRMNTDFLDSEMSTQEMVSLVQGWQMGGYTYETMYYNLEKGERTIPGRTVDEERAKLLVEAPDMDLGDEEPDLDVIDGNT